MRKLESERKSILTDNMDACYICGKMATDIHEIYGGSNRVASMRNGFCVPLCRQCHDLITKKIGLGDIVLKRTCQEKYEAHHTRDEFMKLIKKNYLD